MSEKTDTRALVLVFLTCAMWLFYFGIKEQAGFMVIFAMLALLVSFRLK